MDTLAYTSNDCFSQVAFAALQRAALLQLIDKEDRGFTPAELETMAGLGDVIAFTPALNRADADPKIRFVIECLDLESDGLLDERGHAAMNAALRSTVAAYQAG
jgi:hypothetical protein